MFHSTLPRRHRKKAAVLSMALAAALAGGLALAGCAAPETDPSPSPSASTPPTSASSFLSDHDLENLEAREVVEQLDTMSVADRPANLMASVRPDVLLLSDDQENEATLPMPDDEVYVSVAPYRSETHECYFHSLTTCRGELANTDVRVVLTDADGSVVLDEERTTYDNGFVGFWLPRGFEGELTISAGSHSGVAAISTKNADDPTCITTMQLV